MPKGMRTVFNAKARALVSIREAVTIEERLQGLERAAGIIGKEGRSA